MESVGVLTVNKPTGMTSRGVVDRVERLVAPARAGHAGTLDPLATGVLVICVGQATRLIQYVQQLPKRYEATFLLGRTSNTNDTEGEISITTQAIEPARDVVEREMARLVGEINQLPPTHSALKIAGRRAYQLARVGRAVELRPRKVSVDSFVLHRYEYPLLDVAIECGSGTYIRALARDLGDALGTGAIMSKLERTAIGSFRLERAVSIGDLSADTMQTHLQPPLAAVAHLPRVSLTAGQLFELRHGRPIMRDWLQGKIISEDKIISDNSDPLRPAGAPRDIAATDAAGRLAVILWEKNPGELWPRMNFNEPAKC